MASIGDDIVPSFLSTGDSSRFAYGGALSNDMLRLGEVQSIIYPEDPASFSKRFIEYNVYTQHMENGTATTRLYYNCFLVNPIGSLADKSYWTLRYENSFNTKPNRLGNGSKVLILCVNGQTNNAVILGGIRDYLDDGDLNAQKLGHHMYQVFNGIEMNINKNGELLVTYSGKTDINGDTDVPNSKTGTNLQLTEDGSFIVQTRDGEQLIKIDNTNKSIDITAKNSWNVNVSGNIAISADSNCTIKTAGVLIGEATDSMLLASTYRNAQSQMDNTIAPLLISISALMLAAGQGLNVLPVLAPSAQALSASGPLFQQLGQAILQFEALSAAFLSKVNKND